LVVRSGKTNGVLTKSLAAIATRLFYARSDKKPSTKKFKEKGVTMSDYTNAETCLLLAVTYCQERTFQKGRERFLEAQKLEPKLKTMNGFLEWARDKEYFSGDDV